jgi:hypothetical protein
MSSESAIAQKRSDIFNEIEAERRAQDEEWGGPEHDYTHSFRDWISFVVKQLGKAASWGGDSRIFRTGMLKVAALCVAAIEAYDRDEA